MSKYVAFIFIISLRIIYQPADANATIPGFSNPAQPGKTILAAAGAKVISVSANIFNNKIYLHWEVSENETAELFEIEKSIDGKHFKTAALVFGTDKPQTDRYQFFEKAGLQTYVYRIKLINKDKKAEYSPVFKASPAV